MCVCSSTVVNALPIYNPLIKPEVGICVIEFALNRTFYTAITSHIIKYKITIQSTFCFVQIWLLGINTFNDLRSHQFVSLPFLGRATILNRWYAGVTIVAVKLYSEPLAVMSTVLFSTKSTK